MKDWSILYRGSLSSCNYDCDYCPFGKTKNTRAELTEDAKALRKFVDWVASQKAKIGMLFTPWGEALIRKYYQEALTELSHLPQVRKVAIQTNLSCSTAWMAQVNKATFALWTTYHPTQISREKFLQRCRALDELQISYSVGVVGFKEEIEEIKALRAALPSHIYLWINAYKRVPNYYTTRDIAQLKAIDPLFQYNLQYHPSLGKSCKTGESVFTVDGNGEAQRCHFIKQRIGNIYEKDFEKHLYRRSCSAKECGCHIGYVHLEELRLYEVFGEGVLERIPRV